MAKRQEYLKAPEVMARLRLGRTTVYEQARLYLQTGGAEGIPVRRFGRSLRVLAAAIDALDAGAFEGRVVNLGERRRQDSSGPDREARPPTPRQNRRRATGTHQSALPFTD